MDKEGANSRDGGRGLHSFGASILKATSTLVFKLLRARQRQRQENLIG